MLLRDVKNKLLGQWQLVYDSRVAEKRGVTAHRDLPRLLKDFPKCIDTPSSLTFEGERVKLTSPMFLDFFGHDTIDHDLRFVVVGGPVYLEWSSTEAELRSQLGNIDLSIAEDERPWDRSFFHLEGNRLLLQDWGMQFPAVPAPLDTDIGTNCDYYLPVPPDFLCIDVYERVVLAPGATAEGG